MSLAKDKHLNQAEYLSNRVPWVSRYAYGITVLSYIVSQIFSALPIVIALLFVSWQTIENNLLEQPWMSLALTGVGAIGVCITLFTFLKLKKYPFRWLKVSQKLPIKNLLLVVGVYAVYLLISILVSGIISVLFPDFDPNQEQVLGYKDAIGWQLILAFIGLVVIPPIAEELLFRGFLYQGLRDHWKKYDAIFWGFGIAVVVAAFINAYAGLAIAGFAIISTFVGKKHPARAAAIITSVLFGLVHMQWNIAIDTFIFSFALIYVFEKTGNLRASIALHALKNGIAFVGLFLLS
jgi:membrane protease YdiL (CAAX protease family)